jgi:O-6-methylguanine DNA methyltransferase
MHYYSKVETEAGWFWVGCSSTGITMISPVSGSSSGFEQVYGKRFGVKPQQGKIPEQYVHALKEAAAGREPQPVAFDLTGLTEFQLKVLKVLCKVPRGKVRTYGQLASQAGHPKAVRAVGSVMASNPIPILIPCHRVVPSSGGVGNYGLGPGLKCKLLMREGVVIDKL